VKNYILTFLLAVLVVMAGVSLRKLVANTGASANDAAALVAIGPVPAPFPPKVAIGPVPAPFPPKVAIGPVPAPFPPKAR
jgi:hypothetical protein